MIDFLNHPDRIFNCDASGFVLSPTEKSVLIRNGQRHNREKELTALVTISASGILAPPTILFPYKRPPPMNIIKSAPDDWGIGISESGWMTYETLFESIKNIFYPWLIRNKIEFPVAIFIDGHNSHNSVDLYEFCREKQIYLIGLLPNATHFLQPLDVAVFQPIKSVWKDMVHKWKLNNDGKKINRENFMPLLEKCLLTTIDKSTVANGFKSCGLYPFNKNSIDYSQLIASKQISEPE